MLEKLIAKKQIPVTLGIFITPGQRGLEFPATEFILDPVLDGNRISFDVIQTFGGNQKRLATTDKRHQKAYVACR